MVFVENLFNLLKKSNINFFTGVPDSILKNFSIYLENLNLKQHIIATSEGSAVSIGIGYYLSTKKIPCIYLQNSGLANAINPLVSVAHKEVYSIPSLLLIGWRGSPNKPDEPQHKAKGKITLKLLKLLKIDFCIIRNQTNLSELKNLIIKAKKNNEVVACLIEKDILKTTKKIKRKIVQTNVVLRSEFIGEFLKQITADSRIISTTGYTSRELIELRKKLNIKKGKDFYMVGGMGHSSSVALGYAINSKKKVYCLDGDGSLLMHMGSLRTIGYLKKNNYKHIILNNNSHESVGGQLTTAEGINFKKLTDSLGYKNYFNIKTRKEIKYKIENFIKSKGPSLLEVKIKNGSFFNLSRPDNLIKIKKDFMVN